MRKPRLLDLFCGAGGVSMGYYMAGFEVEGVDIKPQPHYPFKFYLADALEFPLGGYDAYHASPPCQRWSEITPMYARGRHPDLITPMRVILQATNRPYVIENVEGARKELISPIMLCGTMFSIGVWRHRYFEVSPNGLHAPSKCLHIGHPVTVNPGSNARKNQGKRDVGREMIAMEVDWMNGTELSQAIPPAYTEYIGKYLIQSLRGF